MGRGQQSSEIKRLCFLLLFLAATLACSALPSNLGVPETTDSVQESQGDDSESDECEEWTLEYDSSLREYLGRWNDALDVADRTSRINLHEPVSQLQALRREAETELENIPGCAQEAYRHLIESQNAVIEGFLAFMDNGSDRVVSEHIALGADEYALFLTKYRSLAHPSLYMEVRYELQGNVGDAKLTYTNLLGENAEANVNLPWSHTVLLEPGTDLSFVASNITHTLTDPTLICFLYNDEEVVNEARGEILGTRQVRADCTSTFQD